MQRDHDVPRLPLKFLHNHCPLFLLGRLLYPAEIGNNGYVKFWCGKQSVLCSR